MSGPVPSYISLYKSGELKKRAARLNKILSACTLCPRECKVDRKKRRKRGFAGPQTRSGSQKLFRILAKNRLFPEPKALEQSFFHFATYGAASARTIR